MRREDKHIDQVFRDKLVDFEKTPPAFIWENLQEKLVRQKRKKVLLYWRLGGVAAALLIAFWAGWQFRSTTVSRTPVVAETMHEQPTQPATTEEPAQSGISSAASASSEEPVLLAEKAGTRKFVPAETVKYSARSQSALSSGSETETSGFIHSIKTILDSPDTGTRMLAGHKKAEQKVLLSPEDIRIIEQNEALLAMNSENGNRQKWRVGAAVSPVYSVNQTSQSNQYASTMAKPDGNTDLNIAGGISFEYKTHKKWSFQSGLYYSKLGQSYSNSSGSGKYADAAGPYEYFTTPLNSVNGVLEMNSVAGVMQINKIPSSVQLEGSLDYGNLNSVYSTVLVSSTGFDQNFEYLEIPLFVKYQLIDSKVGVQLLSGLSTSVLVGNSVYMETGGTREKVGKTTGMAAMNYSGILGVGLNYALSSKLYLSVEPRFKYYLSSLSENSDITYKPYTFGIYTGISYSF